MFQINIDDTAAAKILEAYDVFNEIKDNDLRKEAIKTMDYTLRGLVIMLINTRSKIDGQIHHLDLWPDRCKGSLSFLYSRKNNKGDITHRGLNGGVILHNSGEETFSVSLSDKTGPYWAIHT